MLGSVLDAKDIMFNKPTEQNCREKARKDRFGSLWGSFL